MDETKCRPNDTAQSTYQVIIGGAGPAGLAASLTLSTHGISHCIIDAHKTAFPKLGDALPPNVNPLMKKIGIMALMKSPRHIAYYGNKSSWGSQEIHEEEFIAGKHGHGYLLDRQHFEYQLRQLVHHNGTPFFSGHQIKKVRNTGDSIEAIIHKDETKQILQANYIIDATGRKASIARHLGAVKKEMDTQFAISFSHRLNHKIPRQIWIEAAENGWWYLSPTATNEVNCLFFTLKTLIPKTCEIPSFLKEELQKTNHIKEVINPMEQELNENKCMPTGTSRLLKPCGENWLAIGDAAFAYDPISSYGITSALATGYYGAYAIASKLAQEPDALLTYNYILENSASSYLQKLQHQYQTEKRWTNSIYWKNRLTVKS